MQLMLYCIENKKVLQFLQFSNVIVYQLSDLVRQFQATLDFFTLCHTASLYMCHLWTFWKSLKSVRTTDLEGFVERASGLNGLELISSLYLNSVYDMSYHVPGTRDLLPSVWASLLLAWRGWRSCPPRWPWLVTWRSPRKVEPVQQTC